MDIMSALSSLSHALDVVRKLQEIDKNIDVATYKLQVADLTSALADAKVALVDVQKAITEKDAEIERLKETVRFHGKTIEHSGFAFERGAEGQPLGAPFCPICLADDAVFIRVTRDMKGVRDDANCPRCKAHFSRVPFRNY
jgi:hypothetical protein